MGSILIRPDVMKVGRLKSGKCDANHPCRHMGGCMDLLKGSDVSSVASSLFVSAVNRCSRRAMPRTITRESAMAPAAKTGASVISAFSVARFTDAFATPGTPFNAASTRPTQEAQDIPLIGKDTLSRSCECVFTAAFITVSFSRSPSPFLDHRLLFSKSSLVGVELPAIGRSRDSFFIFPR